MPHSHDLDVPLVAERTTSDRCGIQYQAEGDCLEARMARSQSDVPDVSEAYRAMDELYRLGLKMALPSDESDPQQWQRRWETFMRAQEIALAERDAMWQRMLSSLRH